MNSEVNLSVIICCYNSEKLIETTLRHLAEQFVPESFNFEIVLVDNNSTDRTSELANELWQAWGKPQNLKVVKEPNPGLAHARKKGLDHSSSALVVFCDDDNWLKSDYLYTAYELMSADATIGALGGETIGVLAKEEPDWWNSEMSNYAVGKQAEVSGDISSRGYLWGAGIVIRREILDTLYASGFKSLLLGRTGEVISSGDDSEYCKWVLLMDYRLWYSEKLQLKHFITESRISQSYLNKLKEGHFASHKILEVYDWFIKMRGYKDLYHLSANDRLIFLKQVVKGLFKEEPHWRRKLQLAIGPGLVLDKNLVYIQKLYNRIKTDH